VCAPPGWLQHVLKLVEIELSNQAPAVNPLWRNCWLLSIVTGDSHSEPRQCLELITAFLPKCRV